MQYSKLQNKRILSVVKAYRYPSFDLSSIFALLFASTEDKVHVLT